MAVRREIEDFVGLGPLPDSAADEEVIGRHQVALTRILQPVTDEEASLLVGQFGPDDCHGLAWVLLHLIESAPGGIPLRTKPNDSANEWLRYLWERSHR